MSAVDMGAGDDELVIYDSENHQAWMQGEAKKLEDWE